ncbi:MAG: hypothetical protein SVZ03_10495 [Spirochaetota bacterium]|nr:hypothetical protein [Spirochaetota bacterium]
MRKRYFSIKGGERDMLKVKKVEEKVSYASNCHAPSCHAPSCHAPSCHAPACHAPACHAPA